ncbi:MAG: hypothetical protein H6581_31850, partial [Bacteroidia bacterium]|nr:hypothetical protein [Bacteroidia bacterium]
EKEYIAPSQIEITFSGVGSKDDMADDLRMSFEETLGFYEEIESAQQLVDLPDLHGPEVVVFTHDLFVNEWTSETLAFLEWYIGEFWQVKMREDHPRYVIFFNLHYPLDEHEATSEHLLGIFRQLDELGKKYPQSCAILEELKEMSASDIQRWVAANNLRAFADDLNEKIFKNPLNGEFYKTRNFKYIKQFLQHFIQEVRIKGHG